MHGHLVTRSSRHTVNSSQRRYTRRSTRHTILGDLGCDELTVWWVDWFPTDQPDPEIPRSEHREWSVDGSTGGSKGEDNPAMAPPPFGYRFWPRLQTTTWHKKVILTSRAIWWDNIILCHKKMTIMQNLVLPDVLSVSGVLRSVADMSVSLQIWHSQECRGCLRGRLHVESGGVKSLESQHTARALGTQILHIDSDR